MRHMDKIGFAIVVTGIGGMAESYGLNKSLAISLVMIITGGLLIFIGDMANDKENHRRANSDDNILDRLHFLRR